MRSKSVTLKDVAAAAQVSVGMASRVLGGYGSYSENTRKAVMKAAKSLDYRANGVARSLRLRRTRAIGVMISEIVSYHWTVFVQGVEEAARQAGYHVILCNTADNAQLETEYLKDLRERGVDGIIVSPLAENFQAFAKVAASGFPMVLVNSRIQGTEITSIRSDDRQAASDAIMYLGSLGHKRIGIVAGLQELETGRSRLGGYKAGLAQLGLPFDETLVAYGNYAQEQAYEATERLITMPRPPTAILVCSEMMTGATLRCLKDHNVSIPAELSVVGFDDPAWASFFSPAITTLREQRFYMGRLACDTLIAAIQGPLTGVRMPPEILLRTELVARESCGRPRKSVAINLTEKFKSADRRSAAER
ncbi:MAG: LacI family DNA-binding transcriptional regulator [Aestuariivirga sp.]